MLGECKNKLNELILQYFKTVMRFKDIVGHKHEIDKLVGMADSGKLPHALLFHGPSGIGKTAVARAFIQYVNCENPSGGDSCGRCPACLQAANLNNPDIHYIYPVYPKGISSEHTEEWQQFIREFPYMSPEKWLDALKAGNSQPIIYVDESFEIVRLASLSAYGKGFKIFLVWQPEKLKIEAANKLLKIIEEPFADTLFIFVSNNPAGILPTIRSRLQTVEFKPLPEAEMIDFLGRRGLSERDALSIARIARGDMNRVAMLLNDSGEIKEFETMFIAVMRSAYARKMPDLRSYADTFAAYGREKSLRLLAYFARMLRESFISNIRCEKLEAMTQDEKNFVARFGPFINAANIEELILHTDKAREDISRNANQKIVWFDYMIELTRLIRTKGIKNATSQH